jgi:hypothetical protein
MSPMIAERLRASAPPPKARWPELYLRGAAWNVDPRREARRWRLEFTGQDGSRAIYRIAWSRHERRALSREDYIAAFRYSRAWESFERSYEEWRWDVVPESRPRPKDRSREKARRRARQRSRAR